MGKCCTSTSHSSKNKTSSDKKNENFEDMPLWNNGKSVGYGIKEMPAYKCNLKIDELNKKRKQFWNSHKKNLRQWNIIHQACIYPHIKAEEYLARNHFKTLNGCINICVDGEGNIFKTPNYCINDPYYEIELLPKNGGDSNKMLNIILFNISRKENINLNVNENSTGKEIINNYAQHAKIDLKENTVRLLFGGGIIRNNETLYQHKIKNGDKIQVTVFKNN